MLKGEPIAPAWRLAPVVLLVVTGTAGYAAGLRQPVRGTLPISGLVSTASQSQQAAVDPAFLVIGASYERPDGTVSTEIEGVLLRTVEEGEIRDLLHYFNGRTAVVYRRTTPRPIAFYLTELSQPLSEKVAIGGFITKSPFETIKLDLTFYEWTVPPNTRSLFVGAYRFKRASGPATTTDGHYALDVGGDDEAFKAMATELKRSRGLDLVSVKEGSRRQLFRPPER